MEEGELRRIAEGGDAFTRVWKGKPLGVRLRLSLMRPKPATRTAAEQAFALGLARRNAIVNPPVLAVAYVSMAVTLALTCPGWGVALFVFASGVSQYLVRANLTRRVDREAARFEDLLKERGSLV